MAGRVEIQATFVEEKWRSKDGTYMIGRIEMASDGNYRIAGIKGNFDEGELKPDLEYRFDGFWESHPQYGDTFVAKHAMLAVPHTRDGIIRYLMEAPGIAVRGAGILYERYGQDAIKVVREQPEEVVNMVRGFTLEKAKLASRHFKELEAVEHCSIDLIDMLAGGPKSSVKECLRRWGSSAPAKLRRNPYLLLAIRGWGFAKCDTLYKKLGKPLGAIRRQGLCLWYAINKYRGGHTWINAKDAISKLANEIDSADLKPEKAMKFARRLGIIAQRKMDGEIWLAEKKNAIDEYILAKRLADGLKRWDAWPEIDGDDFEGLYEDQIAGLRDATSGPIGILTGGPGTGKTHSLAALIRSLLKDYPAYKIAVCAPTGKAAVRCSQAMAEHKLPLAATTVHRLLVVDTAEDSEFTFVYNSKNRLPHKVVVVDEGSMLGCRLTRCILDALPDDALLLFVGDINQLPPIEHGAPLRDMMAAGVPCGRLIHIRRNSGTVVRACKQIREGVPFAVDEGFDLKAEPAKNLVHIHAASGLQAQNKIVELIRKVRDRRLADPIWDIQVIVAVNKRSKLSRSDMNAVLQRELNPAGAKVDGSPFKVGDKVIQTKNGFLPARDDFDPQANGEGKIFVANGEFGRVLEVEQKRTIVDFFQGGQSRVAIIPKGIVKGDDDDDEESGGTGCDLQLGYAVTCHKMQGSQAPFVMVAIDDYAGATGPYGICKREWLYTAISRIERGGWLIGKLPLARGICKHEDLPLKKTFLVEQMAIYAQADSTPMEEEILEAVRTQ